MAIYVNKMFHCLLSRSQRLVGLMIWHLPVDTVEHDLSMIAVSLTMFNRNPSSHVVACRQQRELLRVDLAVHLLTTRLSGPNVGGTPLFLGHRGSGHERTEDSLEEVPLGPRVVWLCCDVHAF